MSEYTNLTSYREALEAERASLANVDIEALVEARIAEIRAQIRDEVTSDIKAKMFVVDIKMATISEAIEIVERNLAMSAEVEDEVPTEPISDETY